MRGDTLSLEEELEVMEAAPSSLELVGTQISRPLPETFDETGTIDAGQSAASLKRDSLFRRALATADIVAAYAAILLATLIVSHSAHLRISALLIAPLVVFASKSIGLYDRDAHLLRKTTLDELPSILSFSMFFALAVWLGQAVLFAGWLGRPQIFALGCSNFFLMAFGRIVARHIALRRAPEERCLVLGNELDAKRAAQKLAAAPGVKARVVGSVMVSASETGILSVDDIESLIAVIGEESPDRVIVVPDGQDQDEVLHTIRTLKALGIKVSVLPRLLEVVGSTSTFDEIDGITLLGLRQSGLTMSSKMLKRTMDVVVSALAILALSPVLLGVAVAVLFDSRGPILFRQRRIGRNGHSFNMYKFRSMVVDAELAKEALRQSNEAEGGLFKIVNDPRITRIGRVIRPTSLDELPQLFNVLLGDMSLVGPRPLVPEEDALIEGWERRRLGVRPGMTGLWQIFGSSRIPLPEMVKIDYFYCANWSLWVDTKIILRTIPYVVGRRGA
jgi:exopolysaccharide biosynthesis polyprenyl glycosylphosphotransferase